MIRVTRVLVVFAAVVAALAAVVLAQAARPDARPAASASAQVPPPGPADAFSYRPEGRRDPFISLVSRGDDAKASAPRKEGLAGLSAGEVVLKGVMQSRGTYLAIVQVPDGKRPYIVRVNDRFADGVVKAITADSMLILQEVNDPLSLTKQREIRKSLRVVEEVK